MIGATTVEEIIFAAAGGVFSASSAVVSAFATIHATFPATVQAAVSDYEPGEGIAIVTGLIEAGLIAPIPTNPEHHDAPL